MFIITMRDCVNRVVNWNKSTKRSSDLVARSLTFCESPPCRTNGRRLPVSSVSRTGHCAWIRGAKRFSDLIVSLSILLHIYYPLPIFYFTDHWNYLRILPYFILIIIVNFIYYCYKHIITIRTWNLIANLELLTCFIEYTNKKNGIPLYFRKFVKNLSN